MLADLDFLGEGQIDEGLMDLVKGATNLFKKYWGMLKYKLGIGLPKNVTKEFVDKYIQDPKQAMDFYKQALIDHGTDPKDVDKRIAATRRNMETAVAMKNGVKAGAKGQNSKILMSMATASQQMNKAQGDPKAENSIWKNVLGAVASHSRPQQDQNVRPQIEKPQQPTTPDPTAATPPAPATPAAVPTPAPAPAKPKPQTATVDGKFYVGQPVHVVDQNGQPTAAGRVRLVADLDDATKATITDQSDYAVFDQSGKMIGTEKSHPWVAVDPKDSPNINPPKPDPARVQTGPSISQSLAAVPQQPTKPNPGQPPPAAGAVPANPQTPPPAPSTTRNLADPNAPIQPAPLTKPAPSRARRKNP